MCDQPAPRAARTVSSLPAPLGAHEQQVGDVRARNDQHDANRSHQQPQHRPDVTDHVLPDRPHGGAEACSVEDVGVGAALLDPDRQHAADVRVGLSERHSRFQPGDSDVGMDIVGQKLGTLEALRQDDCRIGAQKAERLRHDTNDQAWPRVDRHGAPDDRRAASELSLPVSVGQDHGFWCPGRVFLWREPSSECRPHADGWQRSIGHDQCRDLLGIAATGDARLADTPYPEFRERLRLLAVGEVHRRGQPHVVGSRCPGIAPSATRRPADQARDTAAAG